MVKSCLETCRSYPGVAASSDNGVIKGVYVFVYKQTGMVSRVNVPGNRGVFFISIEQATIINEKSKFARQTLDQYF